MRSGFWKRAGVSLVAGALAAVVASPLAGLAASPGAVARVLPPAPDVHQVGGTQQCLSLGGLGLTSSGLQSGGLSQIYGLGAGGFYGSYNNPVYSSYGLGRASTFLNFSGGQPSALSALSGSPLCQGLGITVPAPTGAAFVVRDFGLSPSPVAGFVGAGYGAFGQSPFGMGGVGGAGGAGLGGLGFGGLGSGGFGFGGFGSGGFGSGGFGGGGAGFGGLGGFGGGGFAPPGFIYGLR